VINAAGSVVDDLTQNSPLMCKKRLKYPKMTLSSIHRGVGAPVDIKTPNYGVGLIRES